MLNRVTKRNIETMLFLDTHSRFLSTLVAGVYILLCLVFPLTVLSRDPFIDLAGNLRWFFFFGLLPLIIFLTLTKEFKYKGKNLCLGQALTPVVILVYWALTLPLYLYPYSFGVNTPFGIRLPAKIEGTLSSVSFYLLAVFVAPLLEKLFTDSFIPIFLLTAFINGYVGLTFLYLLLKRKNRRLSGNVALITTILGLMLWSIFFTDEFRRLIN